MNIGHMISDAVDTLVTDTAVMIIPVHPAAALFPMMDAATFAELCASIKVKGLLVPVVLFKGKILDGRNRYDACVKTGAKLQTVEFTGADPYAYVWKVNGERRSITAEQRALIWLESMKHSPELREVAAAIKADANQKRSEAATARPRAKDGTLKPGRLPVVPLPVQPGFSGTGCGTTGKHKNRLSDAKAAASHTNRGAVERMTVLAAKRPDLAKQVREGTTKAKEALRLMMRAEIGEKVAALPKGKFRVLYADPPWQYSDPMAADVGSCEEDHYPTMSVAELLALDVKSLAAADSVLLCWATFPLLPNTLEVVKGWGFKYKTAFILDKVVGTFGHYHTAEAELLLVCTHGSGMTPEIDKREKQVQHYPRSKDHTHSKKPDEIRKMIDRLWPTGPRICLFRRGTLPAPWKVWGNEATQ